MNIWTHAWSARAYIDVNCCSVSCTLFQTPSTKDNQMIDLPFPLGRADKVIFPFEKLPSRRSHTFESIYSAYLFPLGGVGRIRLEPEARRIPLHFYIPFSPTLYPPLNLCDVWPLRSEFAPPRSQNFTGAANFRTNFGSATHHVQIG